MNDLEIEKERLGPLEIIDFRHLGLAEAHRHLGQRVRQQVWKILDRRLNDLNAHEVIERIRLARGCQARLKILCATEALSPLIRQALEEYLSCLEAWGEGIDLAGFIHLHAHSLFEFLAVTPLDLAFFLQDEYSGCQTGLLRLDQGQVLLWHTEEDVESEPGSRFDRLRLAAFQVEQDGNSVEIYSFIYPDLLPGSTFNWRSDGYVQAVDALYLHSAAGCDGLLANIAAWVCLRLGGLAHPQEVIAALGPYVDGYALLWMGSVESRMQAGRVEFAGEHQMLTRLGEDAGSSIIQTNLFSSQAAGLAEIYEDLTHAHRMELQQRLQRSVYRIENLAGDPHAEQATIEMLCSIEGGGFAFSNPDVKATLLAAYSPEGLHISLGSGPALPGDHRITFSYSPRSMKITIRH